jgi:hypothetical protein
MNLINMKKISEISCVFLMLLIMAAVPEAIGSMGTKQAASLFLGGGFVLSDFAIDSDSQQMLDTMLWTKKMRPGFQVGGGLELALSPALAIVPSALYCTAGANIEGGAPAVSISHSWSTLIFPLEAVKPGLAEVTFFPPGGRGYGYASLMDVRGGVGVLVPLYPDLEAGLRLFGWVRLTALTLKVSWDSYPWTKNGWRNRLTFLFPFSF